MTHGGMIGYVGNIEIILFFYVFFVF